MEVRGRSDPRDFAAANLLAPVENALQRDEKTAVSARATAGKSAVVWQRPLTPNVLRANLQVVLADVACGAALLRWSVRAVRKLCHWAQSADALPADLAPGLTRVTARDSTAPSNAWRQSASTIQPRLAAAQQTPSGTSAGGSAAGSGAGRGDCWPRSGCAPASAPAASAPSASLSLSPSLSAYGRSTVGARPPRLLDREVAAVRSMKCLHIAEAQLNRRRFRRNPAEAALLSEPSVRRTTSTGCAALCSPTAVLRARHTLPRPRRAHISSVDAVRVAAPWTSWGQTWLRPDCWRRASLTDSCGHHACSASTCTRRRQSHLAP